MHILHNKMFSLAFTLVAVLLFASGAQSQATGRKNHGYPRSTSCLGRYCRWPA